MFGFTFHGQKPAPDPLSRQTGHLVARVVPEAPCGWVFFDGCETVMELGDGDEMVLPGGAFFAGEAHCFASEAEARAEAARLNDLDPCDGRPWQARPAAGFDLPRRISGRTRTSGH